MEKSDSNERQQTTPPTHTTNNPRLVAPPLVLEDEKFQKLRPRVPSDYTITAEADGMFHGVVNDGGTSKLSVGRYPTHEQAETGEAERGTKRQQKHCTRLPA